MIHCLLCLYPIISRRDLLPGVPLHSHRRTYKGERHARDICKPLRDLTHHWIDHKKYGVLWVLLLFFLPHTRSKLDRYFYLTIIVPVRSRTLSAYVKTAARSV